MYMYLLYWPKGQYSIGAHPITITYVRRAQGKLLLGQSPVNPSLKLYNNTPCKYFIAKCEEDLDVLPTSILETETYHI